MSLRNCNITFDNCPQGVFYGGETVTGSVNLKLEHDKQCQALMFKVSGESKCKWNEGRGSGKNRRSVNFTGNELYFKTYNNLMAEQHMQTGTSNLNAGNHTFKFLFSLLPNLPSSFEGRYGSVRYVIKVTLKRHLNIDLCYKVLFTVLSHVDLNIMPSVQLAVVNEAQTNFYFLFIKKGPLRMTIQLPSSGYVSGQCIPVTCNLKNNSRINVRCVKIELVKTIIFTAKTPYARRKVKTLKVSQCLGGGVNCGEEKTFDLPLPVPVLPPSTFGMSSIIEVKYDLKVSAVVSRFHKNFISTTPIVIGTVPIYTNRLVNMEQSTSSFDPSAPPSSPVYELPPPSYEEAIVGKRMNESHEDYGNDFSPKYPVYKF